MNAFQRPLLIEDFNYRPPRARSECWDGRVSARRLEEQTDLFAVCTVNAPCVFLCEFNQIRWIRSQHLFRDDSGDGTSRMEPSEPALDSEDFDERLRAAVAGRQTTAAGEEHVDLSPKDSFNLSQSSRSAPIALGCTFNSFFIFPVGGTFQNPWGSQFAAIYGNLGKGTADQGG